jgi:phosphate transport system permease protein
VSVETSYPKNKNTNPLTTGQLPRWVPASLLVGSGVSATLLFSLVEAAQQKNIIVELSANFFGIVLITGLFYLIFLVSFSWLVEGRRCAKDRLMTTLIVASFLLALWPLLSLLGTVVLGGVARFDAEFFSSSMRNVTAEGGGALHAIMGVYRDLFS